MIGSNTLFTANGFVRRDHLTYMPSADPFNDTPATVSQDRMLTNFGREGGRHHDQGEPQPEIRWLDRRDPAARAVFVRHHRSDRCGICRRRWVAFDPALAPFDLTNGGSPLNYDQSFTIKQQAAYLQDDIKAGNVTLNLGLRLDHYDGLTSKTLLQPRLGVSYSVTRSGTVLRASYGRTMETPYNENLLLSAGYGLNGLFGDSQAVPPGQRHQVEFGVQQGIGRWLVADFGYFNKHTDNGYDFGVLFDTPIAFPVAWNHSRIDGFTGRLNVIEHGGFSAFVVMAHTNAIFSPPGVGGILLEAARRRLPDRSRSEIQFHHQPAGRVREAGWRMGRVVMALRFRTGGRRRGQSRRRARADRQPADRDRILLREPECHSRVRH